MFDLSKDSIHLNNKEFTMKRKVTVVAAAILMTAVYTGCEGDGTGGGSGTVTSPFLVCGGRNPGGVGIDLDSGTAWNLDDNPTFDWDVMFQTKKGVRNAGGWVLKGAPYIKLRQHLWAYEYTGGTGVTVYNALTDNPGETLVEETEPDPLDFSGVDKVLDTDPAYAEDNSLLGKMYYAASGKAGLKQEYTPLVIGESWKGAAGNTNDDDDKIYIIESDQGTLFKFIVTNFGPNSDLGEPGYAEIEWAEINP